MTAACLVLAGCGADDGGGGDAGGAGSGSEVAATSGMTTSPAIADDNGNPWDLPLEQRPALFDPCTEIPAEALAEAGFAPEQKDKAAARHEPGSLLACKWDNAEISVSVVSSWKSREETAEDPSLSLIETTTVESRTADLFRYASESNPRTLHAVFHTDRGAISVSVFFRTALREFQGQKLVEIRSVFDQVTPSVIRNLPQGDHQ